MYGTKEAADLLGVKQDTVKKYCKKFSLGIKIGKTWILSDEELAIITAKRPDKNPDKKTLKKAKNRL